MTDAAERSTYALVKELIASLEDLAALNVPEPRKYTREIPLVKPISPVNPVFLIIFFAHSATGLSMEPSGLEPPTSWLQTRRSPS